MAEVVREPEMSEVTEENADVTKLEQTTSCKEYDPDEGYVETRSSRQQWFEFVLMCLCQIGWTIDASLLPTFFHEYQTLFHVSQTELSMLTTVKGIVAALFAFPAGFIGELLPRPQIICLGMLVWAAGLVLCGAAPSFEIIVLGRVINGMGLGIVQPLLLSLVADRNPPSKRGSAFGALFFTGQVIQTIFTQVATTFAAKKVLGFAGWRVSIMAVAVFSAAVGLLVNFNIRETNTEELAEKRRQQGFFSTFVKNLPKVWSLFKYPTFVLVLCQGAPGTAPWTVFPFFTQWLELSCFTNKEAGWIYSAFGWGNAFSSLASGYLLNLVAKRFPDHGPPSLANFSVGIGFPFLALVLMVLPTPPDMDMGGPYMGAYFTTFLFFGLGAAMCGVINKKVFSDIVPPAIFTYVFAIDQLIENTLGSLAPLSVGVLTDVVFGYNKDAVKEGTCQPSEAKKLGKGMFWVCNFAWIICFSVYIGMHWTYPRDRRRQLALRRDGAAKAVDASKAAGETNDRAGDREPAAAASCTV
jgi:MFS family permease